MISTYLCKYKFYCAIYLRAQLRTNLSHENGNILFLEAFKELNNTRLNETQKFHIDVTGHGDSSIKHVLDRAPWKRDPRIIFRAEDIQT